MQRYIPNVHCNRTSYYLEELLQERKRRGPHGQQEFQVKWSGRKGLTWEPEKKISEEIIEEFRAQGRSVERIYESRVNEMGRKEFLVKWFDLPASENSWELSENLCCKELNKSFLRQYEVENILDKKISNGQTQYLIKWKGYGVTHNSWEPDNHLSEYLVQRYQDGIAEQAQGVAEVITDSKVKVGHSGKEVEPSTEGLDMEKVETVDEKVKEDDEAVGSCGPPAKKHKGKSEAASAVAFDIITRKSVAATVEQTPAVADTAEKIPSAVVTSNHPQIEEVCSLNLIVDSPLSNSLIRYNCDELLLELPEEFLSEYPVLMCD